ncbi:MAG: DNA repair protein RecO [Prevotella sp.]|nr:DNA repair protein RecO [Bacteroidales bacterium]MDY4705203.1 DNA repair protein RecO [Prevotella sp.]MCI6101957.1 DNA repair protein RecO [Bacteroidales bacterium]MCI7654014.1 DNA repair protein RecO [Bacteroidales bacterium]MDD7705766.1 DNA repair protein RecO [Bacteroidales bacterium]
MKTPALVLSTVNYGDRQLIVDLLTRQAGRQSFIVRLSQSPHGRVHRRLFQPLTLLDADFTLRPNRTLQRFSEVRMSRPWTSLTANPYKMPLVFFVAEFLRHATRDEQDVATLFDYVVDSVEWLDMASEGYANFHLVFMIRLSMFLGFFPNLESYEPGACFDLRSGCFSTTVPPHPDYIQADEAEAMVGLMRLSFTTMRLFRMSREQRNRCVDVILDFYRLHIPAFPELKTLGVVRELF